ncbi:syntaxin [Carpediemonas membranifera]|uniref:Syntaxin n=1 Tax=Carpediemonas membranifera TaxID=201153 RepID=A0A8J6AU06_9EUKA|nr:syntaxin [Carpediemonas membranifera]|eukprot:KAG9394123.1 syntaxin [Carpediemonas membranifera]
MNRLAELRAQTGLEDADSELGIPEIMIEEEDEQYEDEFSKLADSAKKLLRKVNKRIESITHEQKKDGLSVRIVELITQGSESAIKALTLACREDINELTALLKRMNTILSTEDEEVSVVELRSRRNIYDYISREMIKTATRFQQLQAHNRDAFRNQLKRQIRIADMSLPDETLDRIADGVMDNDPEFESVLEAEFGNAGEVVTAYKEARERHSDILALTQSIKELHDMHKQFLFLVAQQSEALNLVANNISGAKDHVEKGQRHLDKASKHQKTGRKTIYLIICICLAVLLAGIAALILGLPLSAWGLVSLVQQFG